MSSFTDYSKHLKEAEKTGNVAFLGHLAMYACSEGIAPYEEVVRAMAKRGLRGLPRPPAPVDTFRKACTAQQKNRLVIGPDQYANFLVRDAGNTKEEVHRRIVREIVDASGHRLSYETVYELTFDKATETIVTQTTVTPTDTVAVEMAKATISTYNATVNTLDANAFRTVIRKNLDVCNATNVRGNAGGLYFVAEAHIDYLRNLEDLADQYDFVDFHTLPLVDDEKQRAMVKQAFEDESVGEIDRILAEIADLRKAGKVPPGKRQEFLTRYKDLQDKAKEYSGLLETEVNITRERLRIFRRQLLELTNVPE